MTIENLDNEPEFYPCWCCGEVLEYAKRRYLTDAEFHARVHVAVNVLAKERPTRLTDEERDLATTAAALGLAMERWSGSIR